MTVKQPDQIEAWKAAELIARRELKAQDLLQACLDKINERESDVQAFAHLDVDGARARARALDNSPVSGLLHGLPLGVKDLFDTADMPTTYGSSIYAGHRPAADAGTVAMCRAAGAVILGKTVSTEFAYFSPGPTRNPHTRGDQPAHTPGGSSSGSAAAVAAGMVPLALGTQTAGSIIRPAAYCGIVGYKPSLGHVTLAGIKLLSRTLDVAGGFGRCVRDAALLGAVLTGDHDLRQLDQRSTPRIGLFRSPSWPQADTDTQAAWEQAQAVLTQQAACRDVSDPAGFGDLVALQKEVMAFEMAQALSHERLVHWSGLSHQIQQLFEIGVAVTGAQHAANLALVRHWRMRAEALFEGLDVLLTPSTTGEAPAGLSATGDPLFCRSWTLLGLPAVHLPFAKGRHGLPVGLQLIGRHGSDHQLLAIADWVHQRLKV